ncbi:mycofactocin biosynthesis peptidyl-dipeptidase MftE [Nocardioides panacihumi]|uniref:Mycofactocin biosynthesis peptidyl-dipeptidase MftE n=1 Tax=Nocardioides panacihumi TaxID=400774 RepID=A0ABP5BQI9_9ACTN
MSLSNAVWPDLTRGGTVLVPVGSTEQHGPHLPLDTDTTIARAVADELGPLLGARVAPAVPYGASGEHQAFAGTISIGTEALTSVLVELARSLTVWAAQVVFVNGHGGNLDALEAAVTLLRAEGRHVSWLPCATPGGDLHAGRSETSLMLRLDPTRVRLNLAEAGNTGSLRELLPRLRAGGVAAVSANGVLGDPVGASAAEGEQLLRRMVSDAYDRVRTQVVVV